VSFTINGDGYDVDYTDLRVGAPVGEGKVLQCSRCGRAGLRWRGTMKIAHVVRYRKEASGLERVEAIVTCKGGAPSAKREPARNLGFPWCPKELL
jgi:hypothetical protein